MMFQHWFSSNRRKRKDFSSSFDSCESRMLLTGAPFPQPAVVTNQPAVIQSLTSEQAGQANKNLVGLASVTDLNGHWNVVYFGPMDLEVFGNLNNPKLRGTASFSGPNSDKVKGRITNGSATFNVTGKIDLPGQGPGKFRCEFQVNLTDPTHFSGSFAFYFKNRFQQIYNGSDGTKS